MRLAAAVALVAFSACAQAQLYTCDEEGKKVIRQQPCGSAGASEPAAPQAAPRSAGDVKGFTTATPIFSQVVVFSLPAGWKPAHSNSTPASYIMEFLPQDQTLQTWREMITVQGFRNLAQNSAVTPKSFLSSLAARIEKVCGPHFVVQSLGETKMDSFDAHTAILGCASMGGQSEVAYYVAIKGSNEIYLIHRALRGQPFDKATPPLSAASAQQILNALQPIKICERSEPQPQCWGRKAR